MCHFHKGQGHTHSCNVGKRQGTRASVPARGALATAGSGCCSDGARVKHVAAQRRQNARLLTDCMEARIAPARAHYVADRSRGVRRKTRARRLCEVVLAWARETVQASRSCVSLGVWLLSFDGFAVSRRSTTQLATHHDHLSLLQYHQSMLFAMCSMFHSL